MEKVVSRRNITRIVRDNVQLSKMSLYLPMNLPLFQKQVGYILYCTCVNSINNNTYRACRGLPLIETTIPGLTGSGLHVQLVLYPSRLNPYPSPPPVVLQFAQLVPVRSLRGPYPQLPEPQVVHTWREGRGQFEGTGVVPHREHDTVVLQGGQAVPAEVDLEAGGSVGDIELEQDERVV